MDAFEQIVALLLSRDGYWTRTSYKVNLTKAEKRRIKNPTCPRWELDVIAFRPKENLLLVVECKSYLNSPGVSFPSFSGKNSQGAKRYKLFTQKTTWRVVRSRLVKQLQKEGLLPPDVDVQLCLAAGHLRKGHEDKIKNHCEKKGWGLYDSDWFRKKFKELKKTKYENDIAIIAAKLAGD